MREIDLEQITVLRAMLSNRIQDIILMPFVQFSRIVQVVILPEARFTRRRRVKMIFPSVSVVG